MFVHETVVAFSDCDGLGHVNHAKYFTFMEEARMDVFRLFNPQLALSRWNLIAVSARCDFLAQVTYAEKLRTETWIEEIGNSSFAVHHVIWNEANVCVARGKATLITFDYASNRATPLSAPIRAALEAHTEAPAGAPHLR